MDVDLYHAKHGVMPPAMFQGFANLEAWVDKRRFELRPLDGFARDEAVNVVDKLGRTYDGIWVESASDRYREAMIAHAKLHGTSETDMSQLDADHVINRACLGPGMADVWLAVMPVGLSSNRSFGSAIEKKLAKIDASTSRVDIGPLQLMKILLVNSPADDTRVDAKILEVAGQLEDGPDKAGLIAEAQAAYKAARKWTAL
ncbi:hypothetical protein QTI51_31990 [Variovorax sp. J22G73]|uniref:hypothetical protein n=1 Tax=unclassified Variovorax TaxID=663243 RepID=UPI0025759DCC|nr:MULTISPECIES: hypothetical protein [unclassified Variovorax]MDM0009431.1 hypothetical protein [Variovorax sp. J22R203]MDM0101938.1 hypothetical protein [Variovorax sp. J22G73]